MIFSEYFMFLMQKQKIVVMELFCYQNLYNPFFTMPGPENNDKSRFVDFHVHKYNTHLL